MSDSLNALGDSIIAWADPEGQFSGYTKVRRSSSTLSSANHTILYVDL